MEKLIDNINDFKNGQIVVVQFPLTNKDVPGFVSGVHKTNKYPISDVGGGNKRRNYRDKNGNLCSITAEQEGCKGDEKMTQVDIWIGGGSLTIKETDDDIAGFNVREISKDHPLYNENLEKNAKMIGGFFGKLADAEENGGDFMDIFGGMFGM